MRDFLVNPASDEADLGLPLPDSPHACSVCLPTWASVVGYEEGRDKVLRKLRAGYPRFVMNPLLARLAARAGEELCETGEAVFLFPTRQSAQRAQRWVERMAQVAARSESFEGVVALVVPEKAAGAARDYQRFTGELISSRMAEDLLEGEAKPGAKRHLLERRLGSIYQVAPENVVTFATGMSAVVAVIRALPGVKEGKKTLQLEFPYVDSLKVQELIGNGVVFLNEATGESFDEALRRIRGGEFAGVLTEVPSNPLLRCPDLSRIAAACRDGGTPLIVDDSAAGPSNVRVLPLADIVTCSLTKWLSGQGDVMGGAVVLGDGSPFADELRAALQDEAGATAPLYVRDCEVLLSNLKGFPARMKRPNENAERLARLLADHPAVAEVWHPSLDGREIYDRIKAPGGGYGPLLSFVLKSPKKAPKVFDALKLSKGPSFGTRFSLACPYVLLAHYHELEWTEDCGVPAHLIRVSCGEEEFEALAAAFDEALSLG